MDLKSRNSEVDKLKDKIEVPHTSILDSNIVFPVEKNFFIFFIIVDTTQTSVKLLSSISHSSCFFSLSYIGSIYFAVFHFVAFLGAFCCAANVQISTITFFTSAALLLQIIIAGVPGKKP